MDAIVLRIQYLLDKHGMKANAMCEKLGIYPGTVTDWKKGKTKPSAEILIGISQIFNISLDWLLKGEGEGESAQQEKTANTENDFESYVLEIFRELYQGNKNKAVRYITGLAHEQTQSTITKLKSKSKPREAHIHDKGGSFGASYGYKAEMAEEISTDSMTKSKV